MSVEGEPPKFEKIDGVRRLSPAWKQWKKAQSAGGASAPPPPSMANEATALPIVTSSAEQQRHMAGTQAAASVQAAHEMLQDDDIASSVGCTGANIMDQLNVVFAKYEVPYGLINKLMGISDFEIMEITLDDSGSMNMSSDVKLPNGQPMTRWQEAHQRLGQMFEVLSIVPCPPCYIRFLNRPDILEIKRNDGEAPQQFFQRTMLVIGQAFNRPPSGTTPYKERIAESLGRCQGQSVLRYFFSDGQPNGGAMSAKAITQMLVSRPNPQQNPITFVSCTNEDEAVEWMKEAEEAAPYCSEADDYKDEAGETASEQGKAFPFSFGMWLIGLLCAAFNPHDLDALDESAPMTKQTLDNILGYQMSPQEYKYYFDNFLAAQSGKPVETALDKLKKDYIPFWPQNFDAFVQTAMSHQIPVVQAYHKAVTDLKMRGA